MLVSHGLTCANGDNADAVGRFFAYIDGADGQHAAADKAGSAPRPDKVLEQVQPEIRAIGSG